MALPSNIEIAQSAKLKPIKEIAAKLGLSEDEIELYGKHKAKISSEVRARAFEEMDIDEKSRIKELY